MHFTGLSGNRILRLHTTWGTATRLRFTVRLNQHESQKGYAWVTTTNVRSARVYNRTAKFAKCNEHSALLHFSTSYWKHCPGFTQPLLKRWLRLIFTQHWRNRLFPAAFRQLHPLLGTTLFHLSKTGKSDSGSGIIVSMLLAAEQGWQPPEILYGFIAVGRVGVAALKWTFETCPDAWGLASVLKDHGLIGNVSSRY